MQVTDHAGAFAACSVERNDRFPRELPLVGDGRQREFVADFRVVEAEGRRENAGRRKATPGRTATVRCFCALRT